jgi:hypothetical protein
LHAAGSRGREGASEIAEMKTSIKRPSSGETVQEPGVKAVASADCIDRLNVGRW